MSTLLEKAQDSPAFRRLAEQSLADDRTLADAQRKDAVAELARLESEHARALAEIDQDRAAKADRIRTIKESLAAARAELAVSHRKAARLVSEFRGRTSGPRNTIAATRPPELTELVADLGLLYRYPPATQLRGTTGPSFLGLLTGKRSRQIVTHHREIDARQGAVRAALDAARQLLDTYTPAAELAERIEELQTSIPDFAREVLRCRQASILTPASN
jgi:hypothetical protein